jgi:hypothetical protein
MPEEFDEDEDRCHICGLYLDFCICDYCSTCNTDIAHCECRESFFDIEEL